MLMSPRPRPSSLLARASRGVLVALLVLATVAALQAGSLIGAPAAMAAPGDAFDSNTPTVFVSSGQASSTIYRATVQDDGTYAFTSEGAPGLSLNSLGYNTVDNYLYATSNGTGQIVKIGQGGVVVDSAVLDTPLTQQFANMGAILPGTSTMYVSQTNSPSLFVVNLATGSSATVALSQTAGTSDITIADGFLWGFRPNGSAVRINPATGQVDVFPGVIPSTGDVVGSVWTFGNGNIGLLRNTSGEALQVAITDAATPNPQFQILSSSTGPTSTNNDGTSAPGLPADLGITKEGPAVVTPGGTVTYTFTVTNNGPGVSSGSVVTDVFPPGLTNAEASVPNCTVTGQSMQCVLPPLGVGEDFTFTATAAVESDFKGTLVNSASLVGNERDPNPPNNGSTTVGGTTSLALDKSAGTPVDTNDDGLISVGDTIPYSFLVTNTGNTALTQVAVDDPLIAAANDTITCPTTTLAPGDSTTCTASYTVTASDVAAGEVRNTATAHGVDPHGGTVPSTPDSTNTPVVPVTPAITVVKSADVSSVDHAGQVVTYTFAVKNTGNVALTQVQVAEQTFSGRGPLSDVACPSDVLLPGKSEVCTATYTVTAQDLTGQTLSNTAVAVGVPPSRTPVTSTKSTSTVRTVAIGASVATGGSVTDVRAPLAPLAPLLGIGGALLALAMLALSGWRRTVVRG